MQEKLGLASGLQNAKGLVHDRVIVRCEHQQAPGDYEIEGVITEPQAFRVARLDLRVERAIAKVLPRQLEGQRGDVHGGHVRAGAGELDGV